MTARIDSLVFKGQANGTIIADELLSLSKGAPLSSDVRAFLAAHPRRSEGLHFWLKKADHALQREGLSDEEIVATLHEVLADEPLQPNEIENCVANRGEWKPNDSLSGSWPMRDDRRREAIIGNGLNFDDLCAASPFKLDDGTNYAEVIASAIFPAADDDKWLCGGWRKNRCETRRVGDWRGQFARLEFVVPNYMLARDGVTQQGTVSPRAKANTGPLRFLVLEQDNVSLDDQSAVILHLAEKARLALVVFSGNESLHSWFWCAGQTEAALYQFAREAVSLGCDRATWTPNQLVRAPEGIRRDNGQRQSIYFFNPEIIR